MQVHGLFRHTGEAHRSSSVAVWTGSILVIVKAKFCHRGYPAGLVGLFPLQPNSEVAE
jgi:hypothetical protein